MERPTPSQLHRRWIAVGAAVVAIALAVGGLLVRASSGEDAAGPPRPATTRPSSPSADDATEPTSTTAAPTTTTPTGRFLSATGTGPVVGDGPLHTYRVEVEDGSGVDPDRFAALVEAILSDPRGWTAADGISLQRVDGPAELVVTLATAPTTDVVCLPLQTGGYFSCSPGARAVINLDRWFHGGPRAGLSVPDYRRYVVSHEVGHALGHGHLDCPAPGAPAPVMMQQTKTIADCAPNPWPVPEEPASDGAGRTG